MVSAEAPVVVMSERLGAITDEERRIEQAGAVLRRAPLWNLDEIRANASDARVVILGAVEPFDREVLEALPGLSAVVRRGVGHDNVDTDAATALGIPVAIVPDASVEEVSDQALALLMAIERRITLVDAAVRAGQWERDPSEIQRVRAGARRFSELTLGVIGLGRIGSALARKASTLYRRILASDPAVHAAAAPPGVELVHLEALIAEADHVSVHAPLVPATRNLVDDLFLGKLRPGAVLVNTSRGGVVDEAAVLRAIERGTLGGAGLDVTVHEPLEGGDPLIGEQRVVLTAHSGSWSTTAQAELRRRAVDAVVAILEDRVPNVLANPEVLDRPALRIAIDAQGADS
jgi:D-3-phosphoglycerate dehydrogenase